MAVTTTVSVSVGPVSQGDLANTLRDALRAALGTEQLPSELSSSRSAIDKIAGEYTNEKPEPLVNASLSVSPTGTTLTVSPA